VNGQKKCIWVERSSYKLYLTYGRPIMTGYGPDDQDPIFGSDRGFLLATTPGRPTRVTQPPFSRYWGQRLAALLHQIGVVRAEFIWLTQGPVEGSCKHGHEPSDSIKCWEILESVTNWRLPKKDSAPWSYLVTSGTYFQRIYTDHYFIDVYRICWTGKLSTVSVLIIYIIGWLED
jgi:hypothetical protein